MADKAVLLGINDYRNISDLRGCVNDVRNVERLLLDLYAFDESNIRVLTDSDVIYDNIVDSFTWLYTDANPDDRLLFHFQGMAVTQQATTSDEPVDELLCLWNMDWEVEDSYLVDDDLGKLTEDLPAGALLTVILDCCHSGTGTKAISGGPSHKPVRSISPKSRLVLPQDTVETLPVDEQDATRSMLEKSGVSLAPKTAFKPVFARFVYPPAEIRKDAPKAKPRSARQLLNHLLLAAARDDQTAADAHIENEYQGAFTYYLCNAARQLGSTTSAMAIHDSAKAGIRNAGYSQTPQLEGVGSEARLFGGVASRMSSNELPEQALPQITESADSEAIAPSNNLQAFSDLLRVHEKVLDLGATLLANAGLGREVGRSGSRSSTDEVIVYVHGISRHLAGYSNRWYSALSPHLGRSIPREEVLWSDLVNPRSLGTSTARSLTNSGKDLKLAIEQEMVARQHNLQDSMPQETRVNLQQERGDGFSLDDFVRYMTVESTRSEILGRFDQIVRPLLSAGKKIHVV